MRIKPTFSFVLLLAALIFSNQNAATVDVKFLTWKCTTSLALASFTTLTAGLIGGWAVSSTGNSVILNRHEKSRL
jgi:uncharacterized integral membrane protein